MGFFDKIMDDVLGDPFGSYHAESQAQGAAATQAARAQEGISEQRYQFDEAKKTLAPYVEAGIPALGGLQPYAQAGAPALQQQQALIGMSGPEAQQAAIQQLEQSPQMQAMMQQGEQAILQNASATGGLRGGNTQAALAQFRPQMLSDLINQQYGRLGGLAGVGLQTQGNLAQLGQSAAAGQASQGLQTGQAIAGLLGQQGQAEAGGMMASGSGRSGAMGGLMGLGGIASGFF